MKHIFFILCIFALLLLYHPVVMAIGSDLDGNGTVDIFDYNILVTDFGKTGADGFTPADIDADGDVDIFDFNFLITDFGKTTGGTPTPTLSGPTPTFPPVPIGKAVWLSQQEIMALPTSGTAWNNITSWANQSIGSISINNQDSDSDQVALAKAFTCARINQHCSEVISALTILASAPPSGDRALAWGRNLSSWVIAADIVYNSGNGSGLDINKFKTWASNAIRVGAEAGESIIECHEGRPNNWSTMCGGSRIAADLLANDTTDLTRAWNEYRGYVGDRSSGYLFANTVAKTNWRCPGDSDRTAINPKGCTKFGHNFDGILPGEMIRQGEYTSWPPPLGTVYPFNGLAGIMLQAELLAKHGFPAFSVGDNAMLRAYSWLIDVAGFDGTSKTYWMPWIINKRYGKNYPAPLPALPGQNIGFADWTHQ